MKTKIALLNGPNLNLLGTREPEIYGHETLHDIENRLHEISTSHSAQLLAFQSNHEGAIIDKIQEWSAEGIQFGIINPGGLTHTSISLRDCIASCSIRLVEVHISHIHQRESFRGHSYTAPVCMGQISGLGTYGYEAALRFILAKLKEA